MYEYKCKILRVVDGDTVDVDIDLGFGVWMHKERVRINGIDTPESRTRDKEEKVFGLAAKERVKELLPIGSMQVLKTEIDKSGEDKKGKFGRILGDFKIYFPASHFISVLSRSKNNVFCKFLKKLVKFPQLVRKFNRQIE